MIEAGIALPFLGSILLVALCVFIYFQRKLSLLKQETILYQERANRLPSMETLLLKREGELRLQGERNAELRVALQRTEKESKERLLLFEHIQKQWEDKF